MDRFTKINDANGEHIITRDEHTGLEWSERFFGTHANLFKKSPAKRACRELRSGGYADWRLPTLDELLAIGHSNICWPFNEAWYWSSTPCEQKPEDKAWTVKFGTTHIAISYRYIGFHVRAVRVPTGQSSAQVMSKAVQS